MTAHIFVPKKYISMFKIAVEDANGGEIITMKEEVVKGDVFMVCEVTSTKIESFFDMGVDFALAITLKEKNKVLNVKMGRQRLN